MLHGWHGEVFPTAARRLRQTQLQSVHRTNIVRYDTRSPGQDPLRLKRTSPLATRLPLLCTRKYQAARPIQHSFKPHRLSCERHLAVALVPQEALLSAVLSCSVHRGLERRGGRRYHQRSVSERIARLVALTKSSLHTVHTSMHARALTFTTHTHTHTHTHITTHYLTIFLSPFLHLR